MPQMPTLGPQPRRSPVGTVVLIAAVAGLSGGGMYWWTHRHPPSVQSATPQVAQQAGGQEQPHVPSQVPSQIVGHAEQLGAMDAGGQVAANTVVPANDGALKKSGLKAATIRINGPLETAVIDATNHEIGPALTRVLTRTLVWWIEMPGDLKKSDVIDVLYEERATEEPVIHAVRFQSEKLGKRVAAYRY